MCLLKYILQAELLFLFYLVIHVLQPLQSQVSDNAGCPIIHRQNLYLKLLWCSCQHLEI